MSARRERSVRQWLKHVKDRAVLTQTQWRRFFAGLSGPLGCNFHEKTKGDSASVTWKCPHVVTKPLARVVLTRQRISKVKIERVLDFCARNGGCCCDCEIVFNVPSAVFGRPPRRRRKLAEMRGSK